METYVKIRCSDEQKAAWDRAAGLASVSTWARDALDRAAEVKGVAPLVTGPLQTPAEAKRAATELRQTLQGLCRHGLVNCRVCGTGVFGG